LGGSNNELVMIWFASVAFFVAFSAQEKTHLRVG
jgi:hypothetical protein